MARAILVRDVVKIAAKSITAKPFKTKLKRTPNGIIKPDKKGIKHTIKQTTEIRPRAGIGCIML